MFKIWLLNIFWSPDRRASTLDFINKVFILLSAVRTDLHGCRTQCAFFFLYNSDQHTRIYIGTVIFDLQPFISKCALFHTGIGLPPFFYRVEPSFVE